MKPALLLDWGAEQVQRAWRWLRTARRLELYALLLAVAAVVCCWLLGYGHRFRPWMPASDLEKPRGWKPPDELTLLYYQAVPYMKLGVLLGGILLHLRLLRSLHDLRRAILPAWLVCLFLAVWLGVTDLHSQWAEAISMRMEAEFQTGPMVLKLLLLLCASCTPAFLLTYYALAPLWERYVLRTILQPLIFCLVAFCGLRIIADLIDSLRDFQSGGMDFGDILLFYCNLVPYVLVQSVAPALMLATLHALHRMVKSQELVALTSAGLGLAQLVAPFVVTSALLGTVSLAVNYDWAQKAENERAAIIRGIQNQQKGAVMTASVTHYHEPTKRLWFVGTVPQDLRGNRLRRVEVRQFDDAGNLVEGWSAFSAYRWDSGMWSFSWGVHNRYFEGNPIPVTIFNSEQCERQQMDINGWPETLWDIIGDAQRPDAMSVPELMRLLDRGVSQGRDPVLMQRARAELWHRFTFPWQGLVLVFAVAVFTPLHQRQGAMRLVSQGIGGYLALMFLNSATLSFARGHAVPPLPVLLIPHALGLGIGMVMLWRRSHTTLLTSWREHFGSLRNVWRWLSGRHTEPTPRTGSYHRRNRRLELFLKRPPGV